MILPFRRSTASRASWGLPGRAAPVRPALRSSRALCAPALAVQADRRDGPGFRRGRRVGRAQRRGLGWAPRPRRAAATPLGDAPRTAREGPSSAIHLVTRLAPYADKFKDVDPRLARIDPQIDPGWTPQTDQGQRKIDRISAQHRRRNDPTATKDRPKIDPSPTNIDPKATP